jgi:hypothetical protein
MLALQAILNHPLNIVRQTIEMVANQAGVTLP